MYLNPISSFTNLVVSFAKNEIPLLPDRWMEKWARSRFMPSWIGAFRCRTCGKVYKKAELGDLPAQMQETFVPQLHWYLLNVLYVCKTDDCARAQSKKPIMVM